MNKPDGSFSEKFFGRSLALISVTDKRGLPEFARGLSTLGYVLLSTGGTAKLLREHGLSVHDVSEYTGSPEILDGRVKTLHPKIHGGILFDRKNPEHAATAGRAGIAAIDLVVVNLYRFKEEAVQKRLTVEAAIEHIDIGGPCMLRAAAKNWQHCAAVSDPGDYLDVLSALKDGGLAKSLRLKLAGKVFATVSSYDAMIAEFLGSGITPDARGLATLPESLSLELVRIEPLRYGENPHQGAALYKTKGATDGFASLDLRQGKELSYNNILDLDAATALVGEFDEPAVAIIKHTNPCGVAVNRAGDLSAAYRRALATDPKSAFGGIVALNRPVDKKTAEAINEVFTECVAAPDYSSEALIVFAAKPNLRVLKFNSAKSEVQARPSLRSVRGALLVQHEDGALRPKSEWQTATKHTPSADVERDLAFAMAVAKHVKSNAIVFAADGASIAIGAGQMSRIDAAHIAVKKAAEAKLPVKGSVMASDAFFPFRDTVDFAAEHGVQAIIQPGGSKRDQDSIDAANAHGIAMVLTGERHFRH